ncbi:MAG: hypothetical protein B7Z55_06910 [Planctomycetales bacterium 12-60-4]|nr:MAG: hypothetical protein B7Z55_06910 [Planctomycetales bacterium 12-60-4]
MPVINDAHSLCKLTRTLLASGLWLALSATGWSQIAPTEIQVEAIATGEEISAQPGLWVMEVDFKPLRFLAIDVTNPKTGQKEPKYIWYMVYRAYNRPLASPATKEPPQNELDQPVLPPQFIPEFTLVTTDGDAPKIYQDQVIPEALAVINRRERRAYKSSVTAVANVPPAVEPGAPDEEGIYGVAMFTGIDPEADRYTLYMTGFSNGVQTTDAPDGTKVVQHRTIEMKYWRPGDRFNQEEREIRLDSQPRWIYR